jgi:peptidoglycan/xylan/chitin deacetylase (PgdA/CDA1 family)
VAGRLLKLLISLMVAGVDAAVRVLRVNRVPGYCVVINYHTISDEWRPLFARQMDLVKRMTRPVRAAEEAVWENGARCVAVTVDDAFSSFVRNGLPELSHRGIPFTLFVPTGYLGRNSAWDDYGGENRVGEPVATVEDIQRVSRDATASFGSHCVTHPNLVRLSEEDARRELRDSKARLEEIVGREIVALSFPYGSYGLRELKLAAEAGYRFYFDSTPESVASALRGGLIGRVSVQPTDWGIEFRLKLLGAYRWVRRASAWKQRLRSRLGRSQSHSVEVPINPCATK